MTKFSLSLSMSFTCSSPLDDGTYKVQINMFSLSTKAKYQALTGSSDCRSEPAANSQFHLMSASTGQRSKLKQQCVACLCLLQLASGSLYADFVPCLSHYYPFFYLHLLSSRLYVALVTHSSFETKKLRCKPVADPSAMSQAQEREGKGDGWLALNPVSHFSKPAIQSTQKHSMMS